MFLPLRSSRAFTLLEVVVAVVILAVLAAIAIPTFQRVIDRTHDEVAKLELIALQKQAWAEAAMGGSEVYSSGDFLNGVPAVAYSPGVEAAAQPSRLYPVPGPSTKHFEVSVGLPAAEEGAPTVELAMMSNAAHCVRVSAAAGNVTSTSVDEDPQSASNPGGVPCEAEGTRVKPELLLTAPTPPNPANAAGTLSLTHVAGAASYEVQCVSGAQTSAAGFLVSAKEGSTLVPVSQLGNTPSTRSVSGPTAPPVYTPSANLARGTVVTLGLEQLENFTTYSCTATAAFPSAEPVVSNVAELTPTTATTVLNPPPGEGDPISCDPQCPLPGEWVSPRDGFTPPQKSIPEPATPEVPVEPSPAKPGPDGLTDGLYGVASFGSTSDEYAHNVFVTDRSNGSLVQVSETSDGVGYGRVALPAGSFVRPSGVVGGPHASHSSYWSSAGAQVQDTLYVADTGRGTADGVLYRVDPNARLRLPVVTGLQSPSDATGFACFTGSDTAPDPVMANGPAFCVYVATKDGVVRYRVNDGARALVGIPGGAESLEPVTYNGVPALAASFPAAGEVRLYAPRSGTLLKSYTGFTKPAGIDRVGTRLVVADPGASNVRVLNLVDGVVTTVAGAGAPTACAGISQPRDAHWHGVHAGSNGGPDLYVSDSATSSLVKVRLTSSFTCSSSGVVWGKPTLDPNTTPSAAVMSMPASTSGFLSVTHADGQVYASTPDKRIVRVDPVTGVQTTLYRKTSTYSYQIRDISVRGSTAYAQVIEDSGYGYSYKYLAAFALAELSDTATYPAPTVIGPMDTAGTYTRPVSGPTGEVYAVGGDGISRFDGGTRTVVAPAPTGTITSFRGTDEGVVMAAGTNVYKLAYNTTYSALPAPYLTGPSVTALLSLSGKLWVSTVASTNGSQLRRYEESDLSRWTNMVGSFAVGSRDGSGAAAGFNRVLHLVPHGGAMYAWEENSARFRKVVGAPLLPSAQPGTVSETVGLTTGLVSTLPGSFNAVSETLYLDGKLYSVLNNNRELHETDPATGVSTRLYTSEGLNRLTTDGTFLYITRSHCVSGSCSHALIRYHLGTRVADAPSVGTAYSGLTLGRDGFLYVVEGTTLKRLDVINWQVATVATLPMGGSLVSDDKYLWVRGTDRVDRVGYDGTVTANFAALPSLNGLAPAGQYLYATTNNGTRVERVDAATGAIALVAGTSAHGFQDGNGASAMFRQAMGLVSDGAGSVYVADYGNSRLRRVVQGTPLPAQMSGVASTDVAIDPGTVSTLPGTMTSPSATLVAGDVLYVANSAGVHTMDPVTGALTQLFAVYSPWTVGALTTDGTFLYVGLSAYSNGTTQSSLTRYNLATKQVDSPWSVYGQALNGLTFGADKRLYAALTNNVVRIETDRFTQTSVPGTAGLSSLVAYDSGMWAVTPGSSGSIQHLGYDGVLTTVVSGVPELRRATLAGRYVYAFARSGNELRRYDTTNGSWVSVAGGTSSGYSDGTGALAAFNQPQGLSSDGKGALYVADSSNNRIRKVVDADPLPVVQATSANSPLSLTGEVTTLATGLTAVQAATVHQGVRYVADDNGFARVNADGTRTQVAPITNSSYRASAMVSDGTFVYVAVNGCYSCGGAGYLYRVNPANGRYEQIHVVGGGIGGVTVGRDGKVYATTGGKTLVRIEPTTLLVSTLVSSGLGTSVGSLTSDADVLWVQSGTSVVRVEYSGTVTPSFASVAGLSSITSTGGALYASAGNTLVRVDKASGAVTTVAGSSTAGSLDGSGTSASFSSPRQVSSDGTALLVADSGNGALRRVG